MPQIEDIHKEFLVHIEFSSHIYNYISCKFGQYCKFKHEENGISSIDLYIKKLKAEVKTLKKVIETKENEIRDKDSEIRNFVEGDKKELKKQGLRRTRKLRQCTN